jgi:hypothetical protein
MSELRYTKRSRGGQYRQSNAPNDRQATAQEQLIIDYLKETKQETKAVRDEQLTDLRGVFRSEADNRDQLHRLENQLKDAQEKNHNILAKRDVKRLEDEARQKQEEAEWWAEFSPTLADAVEKTAQGAWDFVSYHHDKNAVEESEKNAEAKAQAAEAFTKAEIATVGNAQKDQALLQNENTAESFQDAAKIDDDIWGALTAPLWGSKFTMERAKQIEDNWDILVSEAMGDTSFNEQSADLITARLGQVKRHLGIGRGTAGDRHIDKVAKSRINAWKTGRSQKIKVTKSKERIKRSIEDFKAVKTNWDVATPLQRMKYAQAVNEMVLAYNGRYEFSAKGQFISPALRGSNHGQAFDHMMMDLIENHDYSWEQLGDVFKAHGMPEKKDAGMDYFEWVKTNPPDWGKRRGKERYEYFKTKHIEHNTKKLTNLKAKEQGVVDGDVLEVLAKLGELDLDTEEGRREALKLRDGKHPNVKAVISSKLQHDSKKHVPIKVHVNIKNAIESGNFEELMDNMELLTRTQQADYAEDVKRYQTLWSEGYDTRAVTKKAEDKLKLDFPQTTTGDPSKNQPLGYSEALETLEQGFYSIAARTSIKDYPSEEKWIDAIEEKWEKFATSGLFETIPLADADPNDPNKNKIRYKNFTSTVNAEQMDVKRIKEASARVKNWDYLTGKNDYGNLVSDRDITQFIQDVVNGEPPSYPENTKTLADLYGVTKEEVMRKVLTNRSEDEAYAIFGKDSLVIPPGRSELLEAIGETNASKMSKEEDKVKVQAVNQIKNDTGEYPSPNTVKAYKNKIPIVDSFSKESNNAYTTDIEGNYHFFDTQAALKTNMFTLVGTRGVSLKLKEVYT